MVNNILVEYILDNNLEIEYISEKSFKTILKISFLENFNNRKSSRVTWQGFGKIPTLKFNVLIRKLF